MYEVMYLKIYGLKVLYLNNTRTMKKKVLKIGNVRGGERRIISNASFVYQKRAEELKSP